MEYKLTNYELGVLRDKLDKLNKRAVKLGVEEIKITNQETFTETHPNNPSKLITYNLIEMSGLVVKMSGWQFCAQIEWLGEERISKVLMKDFQTPERLINAGNHCEHCNSSRRRKKVYLVQHDDGTIKQVGSSCIKDFCGHHICPYLSELKELEEWMGEGGCGRAEMEDHIWEFLIVTQGMINTFGWLSRSKAYDFGGQSTADKVLIYSAPTNDRKKTYKSETLEKIEEEIKKVDKAFLKRAHFWAMNLDISDPSDYLRNIGAIARHGSVGKKYAGFAASIPNAYQNYLDNIEKERLKALEPKSEYIGEIGQRIQFKIKLQFIRSFETNFGISYVQKGSDQDGNKIVYFGSSELGSVGDEVEFMAKVKKHDQYDGSNQTTIQRPTKIKIKGKGKTIHKNENYVAYHIT